MSKASEFSAKCARVSSQIEFAENLGKELMKTKPRLDFTEKSCVKVGSDGGLCFWLETRGGSDLTSEEAIKLGAWIQETFGE